MRLVRLKQADPWGNRCCQAIQTLGRQACKNAQTSVHRALIAISRASTASTLANATNTTDNAYVRLALADSIAAYHLVGEIALIPLRGGV